ncbi:aquaporin-8-like [Babylonia areolata]|uniref:aquaporin-8-like n=1 Tax=Babylonia areolata TaxID=304850 RepID=UPI003FD551E6
MSNEEETKLINQGSEIHDKYEAYVRPMLAEFFGVAVFVSVGCLSVLMSGAQAAPDVVPFSGPGVALGHGLAIVLLVTSFGSISGGHFNPAVTLAAVLTGATRPVTGLIYFFAQMAGGLLGAGIARAIIPSDMYVAIGGGAQTLAPGVTAGQGILCEMVLTTVLVLTVLMTAIDPRTKAALAPIAIGFAIILGVLAGCLLTGASMNPARSFGPAVFISYTTSAYWTYHYVYWVGPLLGSLMATLWYRLFLGSAENRLLFKENA